MIWNQPPSPPLRKFFVKYFLYGGFPFSFFYYGKGFSSWTSYCFLASLTALSELHFLKASTCWARTSRCTKAGRRQKKLSRKQTKRKQKSRKSWKCDCEYEHSFFQSGSVLNLTLSTLPSHLGCNFRYLPLWKKECQYTASRWDE